jgi:acetyltransferase
VQRSGLGTELLRRLLQVGRDEKLRRITADILPQNTVMQRICEKLGFRLEHDFREGLVKASIDL